MFILNLTYARVLHKICFFLLISSLFPFLTSWHSLFFWASLLFIAYHLSSTHPFCFFLSFSTHVYTHTIPRSTRLPLLPFMHKLRSFLLHQPLHPSLYILYHFSSIPLFNNSVAKADSARFAVITHTPFAN